MSKKNNQQETPKQEARAMTKYDRKMQAYEEQEKKAKAHKNIGNVIGIVIVLAVAALVLSFPIRNYMAVNGTYINVGGEKVTKVEFDYHYAMARTGFIAQYSNYLSMTGMDASNIDNQMYSEDMTFKDYFEQLAVENIRQTKALKAQAQAEGFVYDTDEEYAEMMQDIQDGADESGTTVNKYMKSMFGGYATESRLEKVIREGILTTTYYEQISESSAPADAEIDSYYEQNKNDYDVADYHMTIVAAELPTAAPDGSVTLDEEGNEVPYEPTEEEIAAAMEKAKKDADTAEITIMAGGDAYEAQSYTYTNYLLRDWMFDESRTSGDTTVVEDTTGHRYLVAGYDRRYRVETPTVDIRAIVRTSADTSGSGVSTQSILEEWQNGPATEESFIELCDRYDENGVEGGLYEGVGTDSMSEDMNAWMSDAGRQTGDTAVFTEENGYDYILYYVGTNDPAWKLSIYDLLLNQTMTEYLDGISENVAVDDPKGNLNYLKIEAASEASQEQQESTAQQSEDSTEESTEDVG